MKNKDIIDLIQSTSASKKIRKEADLRYKIYSELLQKRSNIQDKIKDSLVTKVKKFSLKKWWRLTTFKYSRHPLSAKGSYNNPIGGRFNIGQIERIETGKFSPFPALYLADSKILAMKERYPQINSQLSSHELMLRKEDQDVFVQVSGEVFILDIDAPRVLSQFVQVIKEIDYNFFTKKEIKKIKYDIKTIKSVQALKGTLYDRNWKQYVTIYDDPSPSQIFGQIVKSCGIEGICYKSLQGQGKCMALFLESFKDSESFIELIDPPENMKNVKINKRTFIDFI